MSADRLQQLLDELPDSGLSPNLAAWLAGLEAWREGVDLDKALELYRPSLDERDEWIQIAIGLCPGENSTAKCAFFLDCVSGDREHPDPAGRKLIEKLLYEPVNVRLSVKQLMRILDGRRQDGWRVTGT